LQGYYNSTTLKEISSPPSLSRSAWLVVIMLMPVALLNYLDRQMLASMKYSVMADIPSIGSDANWGFMLGQFKWVYAVCSVLGGYVADRFSRRYVICGSLLVWSVVTWLTGHAHSYNELLWTRSLMGISEAFYIPTALAMITDYHAGPTRSRAVGLHQIAIYCGVILGGFGGYVADAPDFGWRYAFMACGIVGVLYSFPLVAFLRDAPTAEFEELLADSSARHNIWDLLSNFSFILLVLYFTLPAMAGWVVRDWMPAILKQQFDISQGQAGVAASLYWQVAAIFGALIGGWYADRWMQTNRRGRIYVSALGMSIIAPAMLGMGHASTLPMAVVCLALFGVGWGFFDCNNMPILAQIVRPHLRATGYGLMNFVSISCGGLADWGFGKLRDRQVPLSQIVGIFALLALVSIILVLLIRPKEELVRTESVSD
jgi:MFS transporter, Spinster family, sphingosine-1-phosphate transporter